MRNALRESVARGKRVLVSFDFAYGYPARFASALDLRGESWQAIWHYLLTEVQDDAVTNMNNRWLRMRSTGSWGIRSSGARIHISRHC